MRKTKQVILAMILTVSLCGLAWIAGSGKSKVQMINAVIAKKTIPAGSQIAIEELDLILLPASAVADFYLSDINQAIGQWTSVSLSAGELINSKWLSQSASGLRYPDPGPGRRLLTIDLDPADANGYWLAAGNCVDLYLIPKNRTEATDLQILENIRIMAVLNGSQKSEGNIATSNNSRQMLCLDLNVEQARFISGASGLYDIRLSAINEPKTDPT